MPPTLQPIMSPSALHWLMRHLNLKVCASMGTSFETQSQENISHYQKAANLDIYCDSQLHAMHMISGLHGFGGRLTDFVTAVSTAMPTAM